MGAEDMLAELELLTAWPDGTRVYARPAPDADVVEHLHDLAHELVARALGLARSPTLHRVALEHAGDGNPVPAARADDDLVAHEEAAVLHLTAYARALLERGLL